MEIIEEKEILNIKASSNEMCEEDDCDADCFCWD